MIRYHGTLTSAFCDWQPPRTGPFLLLSSAVLPDEAFACAARSVALFVWNARNTVVGFSLDGEAPWWWKPDFALQDLQDRMKKEAKREMEERAVLQRDEAAATKENEEYKVLVRFGVLFHDLVPLLRRCDFRGGGPLYCHGSWIEYVHVFVFALFIGLYVTEF